MSRKYRTSRAFKRAIKDFQGRTGKTLYRIAFESHIHPSNLSHVLNDSRLFLPGNTMLEGLAKVVGFKGNVLNGTNKEI